MIDLIIPYYNNPQGIMDTLKSINFNIFTVTIVDDGSNNYLPPTLFGAQVFRYNDNRGPGRARQWGVDHTYNPYIMFIDTGDIFISKEIQEEIPYIIDDAPVYMWSYYHGDKLTEFTDNRLHGKIYRRDFLKQYNITFCEESSYLNEDIGFNRTCRMITEAEQIPITKIEKPLIKQIIDKNSLTQKNNKEVLYRDQTRALSLVSIHTIETCRKNNIDASKELNQIAIALYYWFIRAAAERPEFLPEAWNGARIFYMKYKEAIAPNNLLIGNSQIKKCLEYREKIKFPVNILRFTHDILTYENLPDKYLT